MKKFLVIALALCLFVPLGLAQVNERAPNAGSPPYQSVVPPNGNGTISGLGDLNWYLDTQTPTGDIRMLGTCIDDNTQHLWATGAFDFTIAYLYEFELPSGTLLNTYPQPPANWGGWGYRDLCFDGTYLYAGDPNVPYIVQIDPADGQPTGVQYGPFPITPCRALAYDPVDDSFWTASFSSNIYECFRDNSYNTYSGEGLAHYGAGMEETNRMVWWWSQDGGTGSLASEYDPAVQALTGTSFEATTPLAGGLAGGAGGHALGGDAWELVGMFQGSPDHVGAFDLATVKPTLTVDVKEIDASVGGTANFSLDAGAANAGRYYMLFGGFTGSVPGTPLPGGAVVLPVNFDVVTFALLLLNPPGFMGNLNGSGQSSATLAVPAVPQLSRDTTLTFAYALQGPPWDFASNAVEVVLKAPVTITEYKYDDGSSENLLGWVAGGEMCWMHGFDAAGGTDTIDTIRVVWGSPAYPGFGPGNGTPSTVYLWDDPTDDFNPLDCVLLAQTATTVQNVDTDIYNDISITPTVVNGVFFVGCNLNHASGQYVAPIDMDTSPYTGEAWIAGVPGGVFDPNNIANNYVYEMSQIGLPNYFLIRAKPQ